MDNIKGKVVVITGASSGLGEAAAKRLAGQGATVVLGARRKDRLENAVKEIEENGGKASFFVVDVTKKEEVRKMVDEAVNKYGRVDVIVNNAGIMPAAPLSALKTDEWDSMIDVNIKGVLYGIAAALPVFEKQGKGQFINLASIAGLKVAPGNTVYCGTKHAVRAISEGLRMESAGKFRVTIISPGYIKSELMYDSSDEAVKKGIISAYKKYAISADSVANAIVYAVSQPDDTGINEIVIRPTSQEF